MNCIQCFVRWCARMSIAIAATILSASGLTALPLDVRQPGELEGPTGPVAIPDEGLNFTTVVSRLERELIVKCLEKTGGNKRQAARLLNLSRTTFIDKLQRLNVEGTV